MPLKPHTNTVFTPQQEAHIAEYAIEIARMFYGIPIPEFRRMIYHYAIACGSPSIPGAWKEGQATRDWYYAFMARHPNLVLKAPEGMSIARIVAFNKANVEIFFKAYTSAVEKHQFTPDRIYNLDESALSTVMKPVKVVCERGRPVATQSTRKRWSTMTLVGIINAVGCSIPPVFIIPRKMWNDALMRGTSYGCKGILQANGWMNGECFLQTLQHLHEKSGSSIENKILLIIDNAECHMNIHAVEYAIQHGIVIVTLPPHTTDKLQPLDVSVFGPFKTYMRGLLNDYALMHPNNHITEHLLPEFACNAWNQACTSSNILSGFRATGIWPINHNIFPDEAFVGAQVTDQPVPPENLAVEVSQTPSVDGEEATLNHALDVGPGPPSSSRFDGDDLFPTNFGDVSPSTSGDPATTGPSTASLPATPGPSTSGYPATPDPSTSGYSANPSPSRPSSTEITPEIVRPFPEALPRPYALCMYIYTVYVYIKICIGIQNLSI